MSPQPGGAADKAGNEYEEWWTLFRLADLLDGRATRMRLEPPGDEGEGAEFWIDLIEGQRSYEQVKHRPSGGNWTVNRLLSERVLSRLYGHVVGRERVCLVVSTAANDLHELSERARGSSQLEDFEEALSQVLKAEFERLATALAVDKGRVRQLLEITEVRHIPASLLRDLVAERFRFLVDGDPRVATAVLRAWLPRTLNKIITAPDVWTHLLESGIRRRHLPGDTSALAGLHESLERQQRRVSDMSPPFGYVINPHAEALSARIAEGPAQVVVLHGRAGAGKSTIASAAASALYAQGWHVATIRMDRVDSTTMSARELGVQIAQQSSPLVVLSSVSSGQPALLCIDQLDAVSTYGGRIPDAYSAVSEMLQESTLSPNVRVLLCVRSIDLREDPRLSNLLRDKDRVSAYEVGLLEVEEVKAALRLNSIDPSTVPQSTQELLRLPLHFAVFSRLPEAARNSPLDTATELIRRYFQQVQIELKRMDVGLDWAAVNAELIRAINEYETLMVPKYALDAINQADLVALTSIGVVESTADRIGYAHESFYDYLFAAGFIASRRDLTDYIENSRQTLFQRTQVRQVLTYLAGSDRATFRKTWEALIVSSRVRPHIKVACAQTMAEVFPASEDWALVLPRLKIGDYIGLRLERVLTQAAWFDVALDELPDLLESDELAGRLVRQIASVADERAETVCNLLRPFMLRSPAWTSRVAMVIRIARSPEFIELEIELINAGALDRTDESGRVTLDSYSLRDADRLPLQSVRLLGAQVRRLRHISLVHGQDSLEPNRNRRGENRHVLRLAQEVPQEFISEVLPTVRAIILGSEVPATAARWTVRHIGSPYQFEDALYQGLESALGNVAKGATSDALPPVLKELMTEEATALRFLVARSLSHSEAGNAAIEWLLRRQENFELGWLDSPRWVSRELIRSAASSCDGAHLAALETALMSYTPDYERSKFGFRYWGRAQLELASGIPPALRSPAMNRRLQELHRKFGDEDVRKPHPIEATAVHSPISADAAARMSDDQWLQAITTYRENEPDWSRDRMAGGAWELSSVLREASAREPQRFAELGVRFSPGTNPVYFHAVLAGTAGHIAEPDLLLLCTRAIEVASEAVLEQVCEAVAAAEGPVGEDLLDLVLRAAKAADPNQELAEITPEGSSDPHFGGDYDTAGLNSTRGSAAGTIASLVRKQPSIVDTVTPVISNLANDAIIAVRTQAAEAVLALFGSKLDVALDLAESLMSGPARAFSSRFITLRLLRFSALNAPDRFSHFLLTALSTPEAARHAGVVWANCYINDVLAPTLPVKASELPLAARIGAAEAASSAPALAIDLLLDLLQDPDPQVLDEAARALYLLDEIEIEDRDRILRVFLDGPAFKAHFHALLDVLASTQRELPPLALEVCQVALSLLRDSEQSSALPYSVDELISIVLRLYRQGDATQRDHCLEIFDSISMLGPTSLDALLIHER